MIPEKLEKLLKKQHYHLVGAHSAVKPCLWLKRSLRGEGHCYKEQFYGIKSHRCMQMTPSVAWCTHSCIFCWRNTEFILEKPVWDKPEKVLNDSIKAHRQAISGFKGSEKTDKKLFEEALNPNQVAISLSGEPTTYPFLDEFIKLCSERDMTTFLVTNGTYPQKIRELKTLPTNFYMSLVAPDIETYKKVCAPHEQVGWNEIIKTLELMPTLTTTTVIRVTAVKGINMKNPKGYAKLISNAKPDYVEVKAFMFVGGARNRLSQDNMPTHEEVRIFAKEIADKLHYKIKDEKIESRVVLLAK